MTIHGTSNVEISVTSTQYIGSPINDFIKKNAIKPGSIVTLEPKIHKVSKFKNISQIDIEMVILDKQKEIEEKIGIKLDINNETYIKEKTQNFSEILDNYSTNQSNIKKSLLSTLIQNNWSFTLSSSTDYEIYKTIDELLREEHS